MVFSGSLVSSSTCQTFSRAKTGLAKTGKFPCRVWFTTRVTATHAGPLKFFKKSLKATNKKVLGAPECLSYTFNEQGKVTSFTGGGITL